jgi:hypothetical protein
MMELKSHCPFCRAKFELASPLNQTKAEPKLGSIALCSACGEWLVFAADMSLRIPTFAEYADIVNDLDCTMIRTAWVQARLDYEDRKAKGQLP